MERVSLLLRATLSRPPGATDRDLLDRFLTIPDEAAFAELVVTWRRQMAARADCGPTLAWPHGNFDALMVGAEVGVLVDKTSEAMAAVQNRDQFHGGAQKTCGADPGVGGCATRHVQCYGPRRLRNGLRLRSATSERAKGK